MTDTSSVTITGTLQTSGGTPIGGETMTFSDTNGDTIASATTAANGTFTTTATVAAPAVAEVFTAAFAGDAAKGYLASTGTATATIAVGTQITVTITVG